MFVFFNAFQTEISREYFQKVIVEGKPDPIINKANDNNIELTEATTPVKDTQTVRIPKTEREKEEVEEESKPVEVVENTKNPVLKRSDDLLEMINAVSVDVPDLVSGYYAVNHVFSSAKNANNWAKKMSELGFSPRQFVRPSNGLHYVYIDFSQDPDALYERLKGYRKMKDLQNSWMLKINLD